MLPLEGTTYSDSLFSITPNKPKKKQIPAVIPHVRKTRGYISRPLRRTRSPEEITKPR